MEKSVWWKMVIKKKIYLIRDIASFVGKCSYLQFIHLQSSVPNLCLAFVWALIFVLSMFFCSFSQFLSWKNWAEQRLGTKLKWNKLRPWSEKCFHQIFSTYTLMQTLSNSCERRFELLPASHKLPKDDASQHNDLPKRDFSRVFLLDGGGVVRRR